jgi:hypothetical protein
LPSRFVEARARLTTRDFFAFWHAVEEVAPERDVGLRLGSEALPYQLDVASLAALQAPDLAAALESFARYKRIVCPENVVVERGGGEARISFHWLLSDDRLPRLLVDASFATLHALACHGIGSRSRHAASRSCAGAATRRCSRATSAAPSGSTRRSMCWCSTRRRSRGRSSRATPICWR